MIYNKIYFMVVIKMEYIKEVNINDAIIHILDSSGEEPVLNEYPLELTEETYKFLLRHVDRCLKDEELKYAKFNKERNIVKDLSQEYLSGQNTLLEVSKELSRQMFKMMKSKGNIPSCDLIIVALSSEVGPLLGILKMDYVKNFTHAIDFVDNKVGINIIPQFTGLPVSSQRIQKCAFIKPTVEEQEFNLMVIDKYNQKDKEDYGSNYFINDYLGCRVIDNERDATKNLLKTTEEWTRNRLQDNAAKAEEVRSTIKKKLKEEDSINIKSLSENLFVGDEQAKQDFEQYAASQGLNENINVDKDWVSKKLKRKRLKVDRDIDLYINEDAYNDPQRFVIERNGDGSINLVIKHVMNYIEK